MLSAKTSSLQIISSFTAHNTAVSGLLQNTEQSAKLCIFSRVFFHLKMYHAKATINLVTLRLATSCSFDSSGTISKHHSSNMLLSVALKLVCERVSKLVMVKISRLAIKQLLYPDSRHSPPSSFARCLLQTHEHNNRNAYIPALLLVFFSVCYHVWTGDAGCVAH